MAVREPSIYVGTYRKYNEGSLFGEWLKLEDYPDRDAFYAACRELHKDEHDPELMFQDWQDMPRGWVGESGHADERLWSEWTDLDDDERDMLELFLENVDQHGTLEQARESFAGTFDTQAEWAENWLEDAGVLSQVPEALRNYIDFDSYARDASFDGTTFVRHNGQVWVFNPY